MSSLVNDDTVTDFNMLKLICMLIYEKIRVYYKEYIYINGLLFRNDQ